MKRDCRKLEEKLAREREQANAALSNMSLSEKCVPFGFEPAIALHVDDDEYVESKWCLDSGCSKHMTFDKNDLADYREFKFPVDVRLADKRVVKAHGFGKLNMYLREESGRDVATSFSRVLFVPGLRKKLISIGQIVERDEVAVAVTFTKNLCVLTYQEKRFIFGNRVGHLYEMQCQAATCNFIEVNEDQLRANLVQFHQLHTPTVRFQGKYRNYREISSRGNGRHSNFEEEFHQNNILA